MTHSRPANRTLTRWLKWTTIAVLAIVVIPPGMSLLASDEQRQLEGVELSETTFTDVRFTNAQQGVELAGMLFRPEGDGPFPAAVVIHGSGTSHRDNPWYLTVVSHLQNHGIAVLLPDKRGSEQSGGNWNNASFEDLATDTHAAIAYLREQDEVHINSIGVIGMSQGGRIAPIVASEDPSIAWVMNVVGDAVSAHYALRYEESHNLREMGFVPGVSDLLAYPSSWSLIHLRHSDFWDAVGDFDPIPYWEQVDQPALVMYGEQDENVPTQASVERLSEIERPNMEIVVYEGSGHAIEDPEGRGNSLFRADALADIVQFIEKNA